MFCLLNLHNLSLIFYGCKSSSILPTFHTDQMLINMSVTLLCRNNQQDLFSIFGSMYTIVIFSGINNCATVMNFIATERNVFYRERFARMYSSWAYSFSQV